MRWRVVAAVLVFSSFRAFAAVTGTVVDEEGKAVSGASVSALALESRKPLAAVQTDAKGNFSIDVKEPVVDLHIEVPKRAPLTARVARNEDAGVLQIANVPMKEGTISANGKPLAGATVIIGDSVTVTDATGKYQLPDPKRVTSQILVRHPDYAPVARTVAPFLPASPDIAMTRGKPPVARPAGTAKITGSVRDAKSGAPIAGVEVMAKTPRASVTAGSAITDAKGNYAITGLEGGDYELTAVHPEYAIPVLPLSLANGASSQRALYATALAHVSGFVVDDDRRAVAGARVEMHAVSGPDGRYLVRTAREGELQIEAKKKGLPSARSATLRLTAGERKSGVTITMPRGFALAGRVLDRDKKPIAGASVTTSEQKDDPVRTSSDGTFTLRLKEGTYDLLVSASGYASKSLRAQKVLARNEPLEITLDPGVEVSGRVTRGGEPVEGVAVFLTGGDADARAQTGSDGAFRIADLAPGELVLAFRKPSDFIQLTRAVTAPANDVEIELPAGGRVSGRVIEKSSQQPVKTFTAGIGVMRSGTMRPPVMQSFTSDDGAFAFDNVPVGSQTLIVSAPGLTTARVPNITIENGKGADNIEVALESGVRVSGRVTGPNDAAVAGARVRIEPKAGAADDVFTLTDAGGAYVLENVEAGETTFAFSRDGLVSTRKTVTISAPSAEVDAKLGAGAAISGIVVASDGGAIPDAAVRAFSAADPESGKSASTDGNGAFTISGVAPGHYEIRATKRGYADGVLRDVDVTIPRALRLVLVSGATITGRVTGLSSADLRTVSIQAVSSDASATASVDDTGAYRIDGAPSGTVRVTARAGQTSVRNAPMQSVQVQPGETITVNFDFAGDITVTGRVTRGGAPVPGVAIIFVPRGAGQRYARTTADSRGEYEITGVDDGAYTVTVSDLERGAYSTPYEVRGSSRFDIDIRGATLRGRVVDETNSAAIANAGVELRPKDSPYVRTTLSDANGTFAFDQLAAGSYEATARKSNYGGSAVAVNVGDSDPPLVEVKLAPSPGLTLRVVDARDRRPLQAWYHTTSGDGFITTERIPLAAGSYRITVGAAGYASATVNVTAPGEQTVALTPGGTIVVASTADAFVRARLLDPTGEPYRLAPGPVPSLFRIDPAPGQTQIPNIAAGSYTLQIVDDENRVVRATQVTVGEGQIVTARL